MVLRGGAVSDERGTHAVAKSFDHRDAQNGTALGMVRKRFGRSPSMPMRKMEERLRLCLSDENWMETG